jgi:hypothetical protein
MFFEEKTPNLAKTDGLSPKFTKYRYRKIFNKFCVHFSPFGTNIGNQLENHETKNLLKFREMSQCRLQDF